MLSIINRKKLIASVIIIAIMVLVFTSVYVGSSSTSESYATTGSQGYAVYRDGVALIEWHAAILGQPNSTSYAQPVIHANSGSKVAWASWATFLNGKTYKGVYKPKTAISSTVRDSVVLKARALILDDIAYTAVKPMAYIEYGTWVETNEITAMRCDGVVEYCYEWYLIRVFGGNTTWDISKNVLANREDHFGARLTPKKQAQSYMTLVSTARP